MISWAQNFEDVVLARAFPGCNNGFYVDIGACDPVEASVTRHFYDLGWHGVNVEPESEGFARLAAARPRDINLRLAIAREDGEMTIWRGASPGESSGIRPEGGSDSFTVPCVTLAELCDRHASRPIDFLKIDVEGLEWSVIQGGDWNRHRPKVVVVEVTRPWSVERRDDAAGITAAMLSAGYDQVYFDGINAFYVAREVADLGSRLALPPNVLDRFVRASEAGLAGDLLAASREIKSRDAELQRASARASEALAAERQWHARATHAEASFAAIEQSNSWRLTAPLRRMRLRFRAPTRTPGRAAASGGSASGRSLARALVSVRRSVWFARLAPWTRQRYPRLWMKAKQYAAERALPRSQSARPPAPAIAAAPEPPTPGDRGPARPLPPSTAGFAARLAREVRRQRGHS